MDKMQIGQNFFIPMPVVLRGTSFGESQFYDRGLVHAGKC